LSRGQVTAERIAQGIHQSVNLGTQSTFAATNRFASGIPPFAPALC
jgi:hypothetical protein